MPKKINLTEFINEYGQSKLARTLGLSRQCINHWALLVHCPLPRYAKALIVLSENRLTYETIYEPYFKEHPIEPIQLEMFD